jgi:7-carboxy-7-deazaguanine synthase
MKEQQLVPLDDLTDMILNATQETGVKNICFTGGEPLLQPKPDLIELVLNVVRHDTMYRFEMFSNGTLEYSDTLLQHCEIRMDWKLPGSHEEQSGSGWDTRVDNYYNMAQYGHHTIKFTIKDQADFERAMAIYDEFDMNKWAGNIYAGPVWEGELSAKEIADGILAMKLPWKLNIQSHNYIYGAHTRRT